MNRELVAIIILVIAIAFLINVIDFYKKNIEQGDAKKFVLEELKNKYPNTDIEIVSVQPRNNNDSKYFEIKAKVTKNPSTPCPERMHIYFNYPEQNFVSQPPEYVTKNCKVCIDKENCPILFEEEAIIASHTLPETELVNNYITDNSGVYPTVTEHEKSWIVDWNTPLSNRHFVVEVSKNASITKVQNIIK